MASVEILDRFTYLGSEIHISGGSDLEVTRRLGMAYGVMDSLDRSIWRCRYLCRRTKVRVFKALVIPVLLYGCETWTLTKDLKRRLNAFSTKSLRRIMGYSWRDYVSNQDVLDGADMRQVTCLITERQLRHYGHVARLPDDDPAHMVISERDDPEWARPRGRPRGTWLRQLNRICLETLEMD